MKEGMAFEAKNVTEPTIFSELATLQEEVRRLNRRTELQGEWLGRLYHRVGLEFPGDSPAEVPW